MGALAKALGIKAASAGPNISVDGTYSVAPWFSMLGWGAKTTSGATVSEDSSMGIVTVYACVRVLSESVASLPLILYRRIPGGGKERADDHELYPVFHDAPNPEMTSFVWRETVMQHLTTWGNSYNEIVTGPFGELQLWPLPPNRVEVKWESGQRAYYYLSSNGQRKALSPDRIFHIPALSPNGLVGYAPITLQRESIGLYQSLQDYGSNTMRNSARPAAVLEHPKTLSPGAIERLATQMDQLRGSGNAGKTVVMEEGLKLHEIGIPPKDAQYIEARKFQVREICRMFRIPPHMVQDLEQATFSNIEQQSMEFVRDTLRPWLVRIEQEIKARLLPDKEVFAEFLVDGLLRGDSVMRAQALQIQHQAGVLSDNEWREIENRNPKAPDNYWQPSGSNYYLAPIGEGGTVEDVTAEEAIGTQPPQLRVVKSSGVVENPRCEKCNHKLGLKLGPGSEGYCERCKTPYLVPDGEIKAADPMAVIAAAMSAMANKEPAPQQMTIEEGAIKVSVDSTPPPAPEPIAVEPAVVHLNTDSLVHNDSFVAAIAELKEMMAQPRNRRIIRDANGRIVGVEEVHDNAATG